MRLVHDLRKKYPGLSKPGQARAKAIRLFCLECMGGKGSDVGVCASFCCPLWPFRMGVGGRAQKRPEKCSCGVKSGV